MSSERPDAYKNKKKAQAWPKSTHKQWISDKMKARVRAANHVFNGAILGAGTVAVALEGVGEPFADRRATEKFEKLMLNERSEKLEAVTKSLKESSPVMWSEVKKVRDEFLRGAVLDIRKEFATQDPELGGLTRAQYLYENFLKDVTEADMHPTLRTGLRTFIQGLAGWESRGKKDDVTVNKDGSKDYGAFKANERTLATFGVTTPEQIQAFLADFRMQVDFASWYHTEGCRSLLEGHVAGELNLILRIAFTGNEEAFYQEFILPILLNAHNTGTPQMTKLIKNISEEVRVMDERGEPINAGELYHRMIDSADPEDTGYNKIEREYTPHVMGVQAAIITSEQGTGVVLDDEPKDKQANAIRKSLGEDA